MPKFKSEIKKMMVSSCPSFLTAYISSASEAPGCTPSTKRYGVFFFPPPNNDRKNALDAPKPGLVRYSSVPLTPPSLVSKPILRKKTSSETPTRLPIHNTVNR